VHARRYAYIRERINHLRTYQALTAAQAAFLQQQPEEGEEGGQPAQQQQQQPLAQWAAAWRQPLQEEYDIVSGAAARRARMSRIQRIMSASHGGGLDTADSSLTQVGSLAVVEMRQHWLPSTAAPCPALIASPEVVADPFIGLQGCAYSVVGTYCPEPDSTVRPLNNPSPPQDERSILEISRTLELLDKFTLVGASGRQVVDWNASVRGRFTAAGCDLRRP
jgi:hypothetical protein